MKKFVKVYYRLDEDDKIEIKIQLLKMNKTLRECARELGVSVAYLSEIINGNKNVSETILKQFKQVGIKINLEGENKK